MAALVGVLGVACSQVEEPVVPQEGAATRAMAAGEPTIVVPTGIVAGTPVTFYFDDMPAGASFEGWSVNGGSLMNGSKFNSSSLRMVFDTPGTYNVILEYSTPVGDAETWETFTVAGTPTNVAPTITSITWSSSAGFDVQPTPGNYSFVTAHGNLQGATLEWTKGRGCDTYGGYVVNTTTYAAMIQYGWQEPYISVSVRAKRNGVWSNTYNALLPVNF